MRAHAPSVAPEIQQPLADVEPKAAPPRPARSGAVSAAGRHIAQFGPMTVPAGEVWRQWVYCPSGMRAVNGGESNNSPGGIQLIHTGPYTPSTDAGWIVNVRNISGNAADMIVYAVCDADVSEYLFTEGAHRIAEPGVYRAASATCTEDRKAVGGFWPEPNTVNAPALGPVSTGRSVTDNYPDSAYSWRSYLRNDSPYETRIQAVAFCTL